MEKKSNLSSVDELCIKYVFDELDPSEITLVEQAMVEDENLLIEVESLKSTWRKLRNMPDLHPPVHLSDSVLKLAGAQLSSRPLFFIQRWNNPGLLATAAVVLFSIMISTAYLMPGLGENAPALETVASDATENVPALHSGIPAMFDMVSFMPASPIPGEHLVYIQAGSGPADSKLPDSLLNGERVRTGSQIFLPPRIQDFQLTGSDF
jgi:hypothetical protein